jgi:hypothetical protein
MNDCIKQDYGEKYPRQLHARRANQIPFSEGQTVAVRYSGSRRCQSGLGAKYPYPETGSIGDGTQDAYQGELCFTCDKFNQYNQNTPLGLGCPHTAVSTTVANLTPAELQSFRVLGVLRTGCREEKLQENGRGQSHGANQGLSVQISGKATIHSHTGRYAIKHGETVIVIWKKILVYAPGRSGDADAKQPHLITAEGVMKWSMRTEAASRVEIDDDVLHMLTTVYAYHQSKGNDRDGDELTEKLKQQAEKLTEAYAYDPDLNALVQSLAKLGIESQKAYTGSPLKQPQKKKRKRDQVPEDELKVGVRVAKSQYMRIFLSALHTYKQTLGTPIGIALSDTQPGQALTVLLCGGGQIG